MPTQKILRFPHPGHCPWLVIVDGKSVGFAFPDKAHCKEYIWSAVPSITVMTDKVGVYNTDTDTVYRATIKDKKAKDSEIGIMLEKEIKHLEFPVIKPGAKMELKNARALHQVHSPKHDGQHNLYTVTMARWNGWSGDIPDQEEIRVTVTAHNKVVGLMDVVMFKEDEDSEKVDACFVKEISVDPDYRRRGVATGMLEFLLSWELTQGLPHHLNVDPDNEGAIKLYESIGFERAEITDPWKHGPYEGEDLIGYTRPADYVKPWSYTLPGNIKRTD
ncbi:acetyltransferase [Pseudomonas phage vB_PpuM-SKa-4]